MFSLRPVTQAEAEGALKIDVGEFELVLVRGIPRRCEVDAAHTGAHLRPELQQLETNGRDGGIGELAMAQTDATQGIDENIGHRITLVPPSTSPFPLRVA